MIRLFYLLFVANLDFHLLFYKGWVECVGCADRSCYDLTQHTLHSGVKLVAERPLPQPKVVDRIKLSSDKSFIGKTYKQNSKAIMDYFEGLSVDQIVNDIEHKLKIQSELEINVNEQQFKVPTNVLKVERFQETFHGG